MLDLWTTLEPDVEFCAEISKFFFFILLETHLFLHTLIRINLLVTANDHPCALNAALNVYNPM